MTPGGPLFASYHPGGATAALCTGGEVLVELCIHIANLFYLASFLVRDMLWLRLLAVSAASTSPIRALLLSSTGS